VRATGPTGSRAPTAVGAWRFEFSLGHRRKILSQRPQRPNPGRDFLFAPSINAQHVPLPSNNRAGTCPEVTCADRCRCGEVRVLSRAPTKNAPRRLQPAV
jgi:hypothetical protein